MVQNYTNYQLTSLYTYTDRYSGIHERVYRIAFTLLTIHYLFLDHRVLQRYVHLLQLTIPDIHPCFKLTALIRSLKAEICIRSVERMVNQLVIWYISMPMAGNTCRCLVPKETRLLWCCVYLIYFCNKKRASSFHYVV